jgi:hypothetical protein
MTVSSHILSNSLFINQPTIYLSTYGSTVLVNLSRFFSFLIYTRLVGLLGRGISPFQRRYQHTEQHKQNKRTQISMPRLRFEPTILVFERVKTVHALDRMATVIGQPIIGHCTYILYYWQHCWINHIINKIDCIEKWIYHLDRNKDKIWRDCQIWPN